MTMKRQVVKFRWSVSKRLVRLIPSLRCRVVGLVKSLYLPSGYYQFGDFEKGYLKESRTREREGNIDGVTWWGLENLSTLRSKPPMVTLTTTEENLWIVSTHLKSTTYGKLLEKGREDLHPSTLRFLTELEMFCRDISHGTFSGRDQ